ncbi:hypothetical protein INT48_009074 [Thamnidium elegans]|uniref:Vacuolar membrane protein n=1 Tax=Thamnidium elegans TaxID=101142 RepID=A0A8H7SYE8_9FUNG|nr:hypothetical protein INT48_009074 [Thamnidium elegans]
MITTDDLPLNNESCELMDGFAIFIQLSLCFTALLTLIYKRSTETPQRPLQIWALDVSKQFIGAGMIHCINICISYAASKPGQGPPTNLCTWYFLNVAIDTTLGVLLLWCWFNLISTTLDVFNLNDGYRTGEYGPPPFNRMLVPWIRQMSVFLLAELFAKFCLYIFLVNSPWLFWLGEICINWTRDEKSQVVFVMLIFPLIMNAIQFWLTDTILKVHELSISSISNSKESSKLLFHHPSIKTTKKENSYFSAPLFAVLIEQTERTPLIFPPSNNRMSS